MVYAYRTRNISVAQRLSHFLAYRTRKITFEKRLFRFMAYRTSNITVEAFVFRFLVYIAYITRNLRSVSIKHMDSYFPYGSYEPSHTVPLCSNEMYASYVLRICTVNNADGFYGAYDTSTVLNGPLQCGSIGHDWFCRK